MQPPPVSEDTIVPISPDVALQDPTAPPPLVVLITGCRKRNELAIVFAAILGKVLLQPQNGRYASRLPVLNFLLIGHRSGGTNDRD